MPSSHQRLIEYSDCLRMKKKEEEENSSSLETTFACRS